MTKLSKLKEKENKFQQIIIYGPIFCQIFQAHDYFNFKFLSFYIIWETLEARKLYVKTP